MPRDEVRIAAIQMRVSDDLDRNMEHARAMIEEAIADGAQIVVLPEIFRAPFVSDTSGPDYFRYAEPLDGPSNRMAADISARHQLTLLTPFFEQTELPGVFYNSAATWVSGELRSIYRKTHLPFSNGFPEKFYFRPGDQLPTVVDTGRARVSTIICYERHFPELPRAAALAGAELLMVPVACASAPTRGNFTIELRAHAIANEFFVATANRVGSEGGKEYYGMSGVFAPAGSVVAEAQTTDGEIVIGDVSFADVAKRRQVLPFFRDRRPDLYARLAQPQAASPQRSANALLSEPADIQLRQVALETRG